MEIEPPHLTKLGRKKVQFEEIDKNISNIIESAENYG